MKNNNLALCLLILVIGCKLRQSSEGAAAKNRQSQEWVMSCDKNKAFSFVIPAGPANLDKTEKASYLRKYLCDTKSFKYIYKHDIGAAIHIAYDSDVKSAAFFRDSKKSEGFQIHCEQERSGFLGTELLRDGIEKIDLYACEVISTTKN